MNHALRVLALVHRHLIPPDVPGLHGCDVHCEVFGQVQKSFCLGHKVRLTIQFNQNSDLATRVKIGIHDAFARNAIGFLARSGRTLLSQDHNGLLKVTDCFLQRCFALHHPSASRLS
jgi:hypothetical protein